MLNAPVGRKVAGGVKEAGADRHTETSCRPTRSGCLATICRASASARSGILLCCISAQIALAASTGLAPGAKSGCRSAPKYML